MYAVAGRNAATAATSGHVAAALWNPSGNEAISVYQIRCSVVVGGGLLSVARTSARGTAGSTVTPDLDNHFGQRAAPSSAPLLDLAAYSVQPTVAAPDMFEGGLGANAGGSVVYNLVLPITVPPNTGLCIYQNSGVAHTLETTFLWEPGSAGVGDVFYAAGQADGLGAAEAAWCSLWNPSSDIALHVFYIGFCTRSTEAVEYGPQIVRSTARGSQSGTTTPDADNHVEGRAAPVSGAVLDIGYISGDPTMDASVLYSWDVNGRSNASGIIWEVPVDDENGIDLEDCIIVPPGTGLTIRKNTASATTSKQVTFGWFE